MKKSFFLALCAISLEAAVITQENSELRCTCSKIKAGHLEDVQNWLSAIASRSEEALQTLEEEKILLESAFIKEIGGQHFLIYYWIAEDIEKAGQAFGASTLPIIDFHKKCWNSFIEQDEVLPPVLHLVNPALQPLE